MMVVCVFTTSNLFQHESGLLTVTIMGIMLANQKSVQIRHIVEFKENLRVLLISVLFILLAARLDWETIRQLNPVAGVTFLLVMMLLVRPASVFASNYPRKRSSIPRTRMKTRMR
jgi:NhaP-type Na+/H+ or K+/H+ antiporter